MGSTGTMTFPRMIDFSVAAHYIQAIEKAPGRTLVFDLEATEIIHSSFIGFMIHVKEEMENSGGRLIVKLSPSLEKTFRRLNLGEYFSASAEMTRQARDLHLTIN